LKDQIFRALVGINLSIEKGQTLAWSVNPVRQKHAGKAICRLLEPVLGQIFLNSAFCHTPRRAASRLSPGLSMIFQDHRQSRPEERIAVIIAERSKFPQPPPSRTGCELSIRWALHDEVAQIYPCALGRDASTLGLRRDGALPKLIFATSLSRLSNLSIRPSHQFAFAPAVRLGLSFLFITLDLRLVRPFPTLSRAQFGRWSSMGPPKRFSATRSIL
jgi:hypothetical protein